MNEAIVRNPLHGVFQVTVMSGRMNKIIGRGAKESNQRIRKKGIVNLSRIGINPCVEPGTWPLTNPWMIAR